MSRWNAGRGHLIALLLAVSFFISLLLSLSHIAKGERYNYAWIPTLRQEVARPSSQLLNRLNLGEGQCQDAFPGLTDGISKLVHMGPFTLKQVRDMGPLQARIKNSKLLIIHKEHKDIMSAGLLTSRLATLHQIDRAILTSPDPLPDTVFSVNVQDGPVNTTWSYSSPAYDASSPGNPPISRAFLMPHFSFWGWPLPWVGSFPRAAAAIKDLEASLPFRRKDPRVVWRGTLRYNSAHNPHLRRDLLARTEGKAWADVQELRWEERNATVDGSTRKENVATNSLMVEDFCRYKYVIHTEGITYSGRFQFLQMCRSVLLTPPIAWMQHTTHLVRPLFSSDLGLGEEGAWEPTSGERKAWPRHYEPGEANIVFVAPDWSDLEKTVLWLEEHPMVAEGIAQRQRDLFVDRGYFSPAAEVCYWRALIRAWSRVARTEGQGWEEQVGTPWEQFILGHDE